MTNDNFRKQAIAAIILTVIGIILPLFSPAKVVLNPASFTLAIHVPIFIAAFISPVVTTVVVIGTTLSFAVGHFPNVVVWRAASHVVFALITSLYLHENPQILTSFFKTQIFSFVIGIIHAWTEVTVVLYFFMDGDILGSYYTTETVLLLVGVGGVVHSMVDFAISLVVIKACGRANRERFGIRFIDYPLNDRTEEMVESA